MTSDVLISLADYECALFLNKKRKVHLINGMYKWL